MILPTIGRIVLFHPSTQRTFSTLSNDGGFARIDPTKPLAAIVTHVWSDAMVNLTVFDSNGVSWSRTSVALIQEGERKPEGGYFCHWMPYQTGQAAKTEKLQAQLDGKAESWKRGS
jgi:hypothetical protein